MVNWNANSFDLQACTCTCAYKYSLCYAYLWIIIGKNKFYVNNNKKWVTLWSSNNWRFKAINKRTRWLVRHKKGLASVPFVLIYHSRKPFSVRIKEVMVIQKEIYMWWAANAEYCQFMMDLHYGQHLHVMHLNFCCLKIRKVTIWSGDYKAQKNHKANK
jgi:hypothetical protein